MTPPPPRTAPGCRAIVVTALAVAFIARLTLRSAPLELEGPPAGFTCLLRCHDQSVRDFLSNVLLFLPMGWALRHWMRPKYAIALCLLTTVTIEFLQASVITGRDSSLRDILSNVLGGALGVWLFNNWRRLRWPDLVRSWRLGELGALGWLGLLAVSALGTQLAPSSQPWYGQWKAEREYYDPYPGTLLGVNLEGWSPPSDRLAEPVPLRDAMRRDSFLLQTRVVSGPPPHRTASIFSIADDLEEEQVFVGQLRGALLLHLRNRFESWEMRGLIVRLPNFPGATPGDTVTIEAGLSNHRLVLRAVTPAAQAEIRVPQTVGLGWTSMVPFRLPMSDEWLLVNPLWLAGLILPTGYWLGRAHPLAGLGLTVAALTLGLLAIPLLMNVGRTTCPEWIGAAVGAVLGLGWGAWSRRQSAWTPDSGS